MRVPILSWVVKKIFNGQNMPSLEEHGITTERTTLPLVLSPGSTVEQVALLNNASPSFSSTDRSLTNNNLINLNIDQELETKILQYGRDIFKLMKTSTTPMLNIPPGMSRNMFQAAMENPQLRLGLFRFTATLPTLKTSEEICNLMNQYLGDVNAGFLLGVAKFTSGLTFFGGHHIVASKITSSVEGMARTFIAGSNLEEVTGKLQEQWNNKKTGFTLDLLGEAATSETEAEGYCKTYQEIIRGLANETFRWNAVPQLDGSPDNPVPRAQVAVKLSSLCSIADPVDFEGSKKILIDRLRPILQTAKEKNAFVWIDMEDHYFKDLTLAVFKQILLEDKFINWKNVGIAIQGYLQESEKDIDSLITWAQERAVPVSIRLVKGAYWDYEQAISEINGWNSPVFQNKYETDANYEKLTKKLLDAHKHINISIASHNIRSIANTLAYAEKLGLTKNKKDKLEFQFLHGMAGPVQETLVQIGYKVNVYTPYGKLLPGMAYLVRRLLENSSSVSWMKAASNNPQETDVERLLQNPLLLASTSQTNVQISSLSNKFLNDPVVDFSVESNRAAMSQALKKVRAGFGQKYYPVIDGKKISTEEFYKSYNPSSIKELIGTVAFVTSQHVDQAVQAARDKYPDWKNKSVHDRVGILQKAAEIMRQKKFELAALIVFETGKNWKEALADVAEAIDFHEYYAHQAKTHLVPQLNDSPSGEENITYKEGLGVVAVIAPWNFPLAILSGMTSASLIAGNTVIMKPAEQSSIIAALYMEILKEAGLPKGVCNYLPGKGEIVGDALVRHPGVNAILFTGSVKVGTAIYEEASKGRSGQMNMKRVITEMGGKNAIIVDTTADQDEALKGVLASAFSYGGQKCSACSRVILVGDEKHCDRFVERLAQAAHDLMVGSADNPAYYYGPLIDKNAYNKVRHYVQTGKTEGVMVSGNKDIPENPVGGYFIGPHIFDKVNPKAKIAQEEIFGPVLSVIRVKDFNEALKIANDTSYALTGGLYSRTPSHITCAQKEFDVGDLYINRKITGATVNRQPFGGFKMSGTGPQAGGPLYLLRLVKEKTCSINNLLNGFVGSTED